MSTPSTTSAPSMMSTPSMGPISSHYPMRPDGTSTPHLTVRRTEYVVKNSNGSYRMVDHVHASPYDLVRITPERIVELSEQSKVLRPQYYVGTAYHEAGFVANTWETEPNGFVSVGTFQQGAEEAWDYGGYSLVDMIDVEKAAKAFTGLAEAHRRRIRALVSGDEMPELGALLGAAHNHGMGFMTGWILQHNRVAGRYLNEAELWARYQVDRPTDNIVTHKYGADCVTGGPAWPKHVDLPADVQEQIKALGQQIQDLVSKFSRAA